MAPTGVVSIKSPEAFRTISEVADMLDVPQHVLRFWETRFSQIRPIKRAGGRRFYRPEDVDLLRGIRLLLYFEGYTIRGAQKILREKGVRYTAALGREQAKNGHAVALASAPEDIAPFMEEQGEELDSAPDAHEDLTETGDTSASHTDAYKCAPEQTGGLDLVLRASLGLSTTSPRRARLESLRAELQELKSRLAAARSHSL
jgi:DNA-binding transcriptional MerR regulator